MVDIFLIRHGSMVSARNDHIQGVYSPTSLLQKGKRTLMQALMNGFRRHLHLPVQLRHLRCQWRNVVVASLQDPQVTRAKNSLPVGCAAPRLRCRLKKSSLFTWITHGVYMWAWESPLSGVRMRKAIHLHTSERLLLSMVIQ